MQNTNELPYDDKSHEMLERAISALGGSTAAREVVGKVYALGRIDGRTEQVVIDHERLTAAKLTV